jgi:hypothetical protein
LSSLLSWPRLRRLALPVLLFAGTVSAVSAPAANAADAGSVQFMRSAEASFDNFTRSPTTAQQSWIRGHYERMKTYTPYFDSRLSWYTAGAWTYRDSYAIYAGDTSHPEWILKDASGNKLFVQWNCKNGTCPQYAADIGNPAYRKDWIDKAKQTMATGYTGLYIDDVNMYRMVSNGNQTSTDPKDPRTGGVLTEALWQRYMADFMAEVRAAFPTKEIIHNVIWYVPDSPDVRRLLKSADIVALERGFNDAGLTSGTGRWSLQAFMKFIATRQAEGHRVVLDANSTTAAGRLYGLAGYFMVNSGRDLTGNATASSPADWWTGYDVELGAATNARYVWNGVWRRDFAHGTVLLNEPRNTTRSVTLPAGYRDLGGVERRSLTFAGGTGAVLLTGAAVPPPGAGLAPAPAAQPAPAPSSAPVRAAAQPTLAPHAATVVPSSGAPRSERLVLRLRVLPVASASARRSAARTTVRVSGVVRGARAGRVTLAARAAGSARRTSLRVGPGGRFARTLKLTHGRWRVKVAYRRHGSAAVSASAARSVRVG